MAKKDEQTWAKALANSWDRWHPPDRPSPGEMKVHEEYLLRVLARNKKPNVMVLGSTSEFRDLYSKYKVPCTVVDYSADNYQALGLLMKRKKYQETLLVKDWRTVRPKEKFDLVLGDYCINVIPKEDQPKFIKNISRLLKPEGYCLLKTFVRYDAQRGDLAKSLHYYRTEKKHRPILETIMAPMFKSVYNFKKEYASPPLLHKKFARLYKEKKMTKDEFDYFCSLNLKDVSLRVYIPFLSDVLKFITDNATLHGNRFGGEWFSHDVPILIIKK